MKISVIITTILVAQVCGSLFDVFHGAVLSVQNGFGKLLSDVVTDVKDTVDCTILAVEHVLSLSPDATARYYNKCGTNKTDSISDAPQNTSLPKVEVTFNLPNNDEFLQKVIPTEIDEKINETLSKVLDNYKSHDNVLTIEKVLAKESEQLADVRGIVKKELEKLSNDVTIDLKNIDKQRNSQPSVDTILQEIKVLEKRLLITKNTTEANEIHQEINQLLGKLDAMKATEATENVKLEEILKELENNSNNSFVGIRHQFEQWKEEESRNLNKIKSKIEEHEKISELHNGSYHIHESNQTGNNNPISSYLETSSNNTTLIKDMLDNSTSSSTFGNGKTLTSVENDVLFSQNKTFEHSGVNDAVNTSNSYFNTERSIGNEIIHQFESLTSLGSSELSRSVNQSTTPKNHQVIDTTTESEKQQKLLTSRESTITIFENNSNESVINVSNPKQELEIEGVKLHVKSKNDAIKKLSFDSAENIVTIIRSAVETEITATTQNNHNLNDIVISNKSNAVVKNISVNAINPVNIVSSTLPTNEIVILETFDDIKSNDAIIINTLSSINSRTLVNKTIIPIETTSTVGNVEFSKFTTIIVQDSDDSDDTKITSTTIPIVKYAPASENIHPIESITASSQKESTTTIVHSNDVVTESVQNLLKHNNVQIEETSNIISNNTMITSYSSPIAHTAISQNFEPKEKITALGNEKSLNISNESIIITPLPMIENTLLGDNFEVTELIATLKIENGSYTTITSLSPIVSTSESEKIQAINITTILSSKKESTYLTASETSETASGDDDSTVSVVTSTSDTISESTLEVNVAASEYRETLTMGTFTANLTDSVTSIPLPLKEITIIDFVENTTPTENKEPTILILKPATIPDEVENKNIGSTDTVASATNNIERIQKIETSTASEEQDVSTTFTQSAISEIVTTSITLPPTDRIPISEEDLGKLPRLEATPFLTTLNIPDLNYSIRSPSLTVTTETTELKQQNYNASEDPGNDYDYKVLKSLSDSSLQTRQQLINPEAPIYNQPVVSPKIRDKDKLQDTDNFASFDAMDEQLLHLSSPVDNNIAITNIPLIPELTNSPRKSPRMNLEKISFVPPLYPIRPPLSSGDKASENTYRPPILTTHTPRIPEPRANNYKSSSSMDYDSFFHTPPKNSKAHKRALKEALQLIANSKRTDRIINNIMKNKSKFNARSIFNV